MYFFLPPFFIEHHLLKSKIIIRVPNRIWLLYLKDKNEETRMLISKCDICIKHHPTKTQGWLWEKGWQIGKNTETKFWFHIRARPLHAWTIIDSNYKHKNSMHKILSAKQSMDKRQFCKALSLDEELLGICGCKGVEGWFSSGTWTIGVCYCKWSYIYSHRDMNKWVQWILKKAWKFSLSRHTLNPTATFL